MVCVEMLLKIIIAALFIKYRTVGDHVKKKATLFGQTYNFDGKLTTANLVSAALP